MKTNYCINKIILFSNLNGEFRTSFIPANHYHFLNSNA